MSEEYPHLGTNKRNGFDRNRKIKISNKIQLLPSKILLENLISEYKNKMHVNDTCHHKSDTAKSRFNSQAQDKERSKSSSDSSSNSFWDTQESLRQDKQRNNSIPCESNNHSESSKIIVHQNIIIASPIRKKQDSRENQADNKKPEEKRTNAKQSILLDLKMHFNRRPPNSAPAKATTKFEFDFDNKQRGSDRFYVKETINIDATNARLHSKIFETGNSSVYFKNKIYADNQNVKSSSTTNLRKNNFYTHQNDRFSMHENVSTNNSNTDNEVITSTSKSTPRRIYNIYVDENQNFNMPKDQRKVEENALQKDVDYNKEQNGFECDTSSKYVSSPLNEAFLTNSSIKLDASCYDSYAPVVPNCSKNKDVPKRKKTDEKERDMDNRNYVNKNNYLLELPYTGDIYNTEYLEEIFQNIKRLEKKIVLQDEFLHKHNPDRMCRSEIVNWMLKIQQSEFCYTESEFYLAVYFLDKILANVYIPVDLYQLLALSAIWIATKLIGIEEISVSTMVNLTQGVYSKEELLQMEANVLNIMNFELYTAEPSLCVCYYLKLFNLETIDLARLSAFYALDFFALLPEFSSTPMTLLAAAVINFVQNVYHKSALSKVNTFFQKILSKGEIEQIKSLERKLYSQLNKMGDENYIFKEAYRKYENEGLMSISKYMHTMAFKYPT